MRDYDYDYYKSLYDSTMPIRQAQQSAQMSAGEVALALILTLILVALTVLAIVGLWRVFKKAGRPGWISIVPVYNMVTLLQIVGRPDWWILLTFVPIANIVVAVTVMIDLAKSFGKSTAFGVLAFFFPMVMYMILGFDSSRYLGPAAYQVGYENPPQQGDVPSESESEEK